MSSTQCHSFCFYDKKWSWARINTWLFFLPNPWLNLKKSKYLHDHKTIKYTTNYRNVIGEQEYVATVRDIHYSQCTRSAWGFHRACSCMKFTRQYLQVWKWSFTRQFHSFHAAMIDVQWNLSGMITLDVKKKWFLKTGLVCIDSNGKQKNGLSREGDLYRGGCPRPVSNLQHTSLILPRGDCSNAWSFLSCIRMVSAMWDFKCYGYGKGSL